LKEVLPKVPKRPLFWSDIVLDLCDLLADDDIPLYIVGGAVRDAYLHHPINDLDLTTPQDAIRLGRRIANLLGGDFYVLDEARDVARILLDTPREGRVVIDIARFRGDSLLADLKDRDFTINAMAVDLKADVSLLLDPLNGESDLIKRIVRRCSDRSIADDPVRALRAIRQSVQFTCRIEPATMKDMQEINDALLSTSPERLRDEFFKILKLSKPVMALRVADKLGLLEKLVPEVVPLHGLEQAPPHIYDCWQHTLLVIEKLSAIQLTISPRRTDETAATFDMGMIVMALDRYRKQLQSHLSTELSDGRTYESLLLFTALMHDVSKPTIADSTPQSDDYAIASANLASRRTDALHLSNFEKQRAVSIIRNHKWIQGLDDKPDKLSIHRFWHQLGEAGISVCLFSLADYLGTVGIRIDQDVWIKLLEKVRLLLDAYYVHYDEIVAPSPVIDGNDLMQALDLSPGKVIGTLLDAIREAQAVGDVLSQADALTLAKHILAEEKDLKA